MDYWGTVIVARPEGLLVDQDGVGGFGHRQRWLRDLSDGWQMLEVTGFNDPPDLLAPCDAVTASTGWPVLAAYISDSHCAVLATAIPGQAAALTHVWDVSGPCGVFQHQPYGKPEPVGRTLDAVIADWVAWSEAAGREADPARLRAIAGRADDEVHSEADSMVFELVQALGMRTIGRTKPWALPAYDWPFSMIMGVYGPASRAREYAKERADGGEDCPAVEPWEPRALALETELWGSLYRPGVDAVALARRAADVYAEYRAHRKQPLPDRNVADDLAELEARLAGGIPPRWSAEFEARAWADSRATVP